MGPANLSPADYLLLLAHEAIADPETVDARSPELEPWQLDQVRVALAFWRSPPGLRYKALFEHWSLEEIQAAL